MKRYSRKELKMALKTNTVTHDMPSFIPGKLKEGG